MALSAFAGNNLIICGNHPGQIYFVGLDSTQSYCPILYYSPDFGQTIQPRDTAHNIFGIPDYGTLLPDPADSTFYRNTLTTSARLDLTTDGGLTWDSVGVPSSSDWPYATGTTAGEIYHSLGNQLERSVDYGRTFAPCSTLGLPTGQGIHDLALGITPGEVYLLATDECLYYSTDFGEHFIFLNDLWQTWNIQPDARLLNGATPGEIYIRSGFEFTFLLRVYDYGTQLDTAGSWLLGYDVTSGFTASRTPGEVYFLHLDWEMTPGGTMYIYHTTNYGQDWTCFTHIMGPYHVPKAPGASQPSVFSCKVYPNPFNPSSVARYELRAASHVSLRVYDTAGREVRTLVNGWRPAGVQKVAFDGTGLAAGVYLLQMEAGGDSRVQKVVLLK